MKPPKITTPAVRHVLLLAVQHDLRRIGTILTVWNVYAGSIGGFCMKDPQTFTVRKGEAIANG